MSRAQLGRIAAVVVVVVVYRDVISKVLLTSTKTSSIKMNQKRGIGRRVFLGPFIIHQEASTTATTKSRNLPLSERPSLHLNLESVYLTKSLFPHGPRRKRSWEVT